MIESAAENPPQLRKAEIAASWCLRIGTIASIALILAGVGITIARHPDWLWDREAFTRLVAQDSTAPHSLTEAMQGLMSFEGRSIIQLGVICLIMTPVLRVIVSAIAFARAKDRIFVGLAIGVLILLLAGYIAGAQRIGVADDAPSAVR